MSLDMAGHIDDCFQSVPANRYRNGTGEYVEGIWEQSGPDVVTPHKVTIQPLSEKELQDAQIMLGAERVLDSRKVYVNDGDLYKISPADEWQFEGIEGRFKTAKLDNRPWRNYCKVIVMIIDDKAKV